MGAKNRAQRDAELAMAPEFEALAEAIRRLPKDAARQEGQVNRAAESGISDIWRGFGAATRTISQQVAGSNMGQSGMRGAALDAAAGERMSAEGKIVTEKTAQLVNIAQGLQDKLDEARTQKKALAGRQQGLYLQLLDKYRVEEEQMALAREEAARKREEAKAAKLQADAASGNLTTFQQVKAAIIERAKQNLQSGKLGTGAFLPSQILSEFASLYPELVGSNAEKLTKDAGVMAYLYPKSYRQKISDGWTLSTSTVASATGRSGSLAASDLPLLGHSGQPTRGNEGWTGSLGNPVGNPVTMLDNTKRAKSELTAYMASKKALDPKWNASRALSGDPQLQRLVTSAGVGTIFKPTFDEKMQSNPLLRWGQEAVGGGPLQTAAGVGAMGLGASVAGIGEWANMMWNGSPDYLDQSKIEEELRKRWSL